MATSRGAVGPGVSSGSTTANQGTANTVSNAWPTKMVDSAGVNTATVSAAGAVKVDGSAVTQPVSMTGSISTYAGMDPTWTGVYFHAIVDAVGTVTSNNYLSVFNPIGSGKIAIALGFMAGSYSVAAVTSVTSLTAYRITASSAGTLTTAANVNRFLTTFPDPVSEVRSGNPTVTTVGSKMIGIPPAIGDKANANSLVAPTPGASFVFLPGQGIVFNVPQGDTDQLWNLQYIWAEKSL